MAQAAPSIEDLIKRLDSLDPEQRYQGLEAVRRYVTHRKVHQAVFDLRNDPDRRVRALARELLEEADKRTSSSLSVPGADAQERDAYLQELIAGLKATDPTDRVTALKELRMMDDPRAIEAVERMRKDPNRVVRMLAEEAHEARQAEKRPKTSAFEGNVMVSSPVSETPRQEWRERTASRLGPELVPFIGFGYLILGLPFAVACLWMWLDRQGAFDPQRLALFDPGFAPKPSQVESFRRTGIPIDPLSLAFAFAVGAVQTMGGLGMMLRFDAGRRLILLFHAGLFLFGLLLPGLVMKLIPGLVSAIIVYYLTRPQIVATFRGAVAPTPSAKTANYGDMERKVW